MRYNWLLIALILSFSSSAFAQGKDNTKCRVGDVAIDFSFFDNHEKEIYMSEVESPNILLFFYSPQCEHCQDYIKKMSKIKKLSTLIAMKKISVIAVAIESNSEEFSKSFFELPIAWIKGYCEDCEQIIDNYLMDVPAIFIIDDAKMVLKSDITPKDLEAFLKELDKNTDE
jgi:thiol-disulfide isomerase/thioredoxin